MDAMLNYTFSGIMQVDRDGSVRRINRAGYDLLGKAPGELLGWPITQLLPNLSEKVLQDTLYQGKEAYAFLLDINHKAVIVNIAPVEVDGEIEGAVLTFQEGRRITEMDNELRRELYQRGFIAKYNFDNLVCESAESRQMIALARRIAKYAAPVMITGESGTGKSILAQCIHNESLMRKNAFVPWTAAPGCPRPWTICSLATTPSATTPATAWPSLPRTAPSTSATWRPCLWRPSISCLT